MNGIANDESGDDIYEDIILNDLATVLICLMIAPTSFSKASPTCPCFSGLEEWEEWNIQLKNGS